MSESKTTTYKLPLRRQDILDAINRVIPWSSDALNHDGHTLTGHELTCIRDFVEKINVR